MKRIKLSNGRFTIVDDEDFLWLSQFHWYTNSGKWNLYANREVMTEGKTSCFLMHREIMMHHGYKIEGFYVDHINHNGLDNRKENLRMVTASQNQMNRLPIKSLSGYKGVTIYRNGKWRASAKVDQKNVHLGYFDTKEEAAIAYNSFAQRQFGSFAYLNVIGGKQ